MKQFQIGKTYTDNQDFGIEIIITKRTKTTVTFEYTTPHWYEGDTKKTHRKKIKTHSPDCEIIELGTHWSDPNIKAS